MNTCMALHMRSAPVLAPAGDEQVYPACDKFGPAVDMDYRRQHVRRRTCCICLPRVVLRHPPYLARLRHGCAYRATSNIVWKYNII